MTRRAHWWRPLAGLCLVVSTACAQVVPLSLPTRSNDSVGTTARSQEAATGSRPAAGQVREPVAPPTEEPAVVQTPAPLAVSSNRRVAVRRGPIAEVAQLNGRVVGADEVDLSFQFAGNVKTVVVTQGQAVTAGQPLIELDSRVVVRDLNQARGRVEAARVRLDQMVTKQASDRQDALNRLTADRRAAEAAVLTAQANLDRAASDMAKLYPTDLDTRGAELSVATARLALEKALADQDRLLHPAPTLAPVTGPAAVPTLAAQPGTPAADPAVIAAKTQLTQAQAALDKLLQPPDPTLLREAERQMERANYDLVLAQTAPTVDPRTGIGTGQNRDQAVVIARLAASDALDRLTQLRRPPSGPAVDAARKAVDDAQAAVTVAEQRAADNAAAAAAAAAARASGPNPTPVAVQSPDQLALEAANLAVERARIDLLKAQAATNRGPSQQEVDKAQAAINSAQEALTAAQTQADAARLRELAGPAAVDDRSGYDQKLQQKALDDEVANLRALEAEAAGLSLTAPFPGVVSALQVQVGSKIEADRPVITLSRAADPVVQALLTAADAARVVAGQRATVLLDGGDGTELAGSVTGVSNAPTGPGTVAYIRVAWGPNRPLVGTMARLTIAVKEKSDALLVPRRAVVQQGDLHYVQYLDGETVRSALVIVGMVTRNDAEIITGLDEGQLILVGP